MEYNKKTVNYGLCRCCLTKGIHRNLMTDYYCNGIREVYSEILEECFNISLCNDKKMTTLICSKCVQQLRESLDFKIRVQHSEKHLLGILNSENNKETVFINCNIIESKAELKEEITIKEEKINEDIDLYSEYHSEEFFTEELDFREKDLLRRFPKSSLPVLPNRSKLRTICPYYFYQLEKLKDMTITGTMLQDSFSKKLVSTNPTSEKDGHIINITTLLTYSNLTAFGTRYKNGFKCFYCSIRCEDLEILRDHQRVHKKDNLAHLVKTKYKPGRPDCLVVYAEITDLKCTICDEDIPNLNILKTHLTGIHKKEMHLQYTDRVIPIKVLEKRYQCQICSFSFETFGTTEKHLNTHYRHFVCDECGAGFISKNRWKIHTYQLHRGVGDFPCQICGKSFHTSSKLKIHVNLVHKMMKAIKCQKCPARFAYSYVYSKHLVQAHGMTPIKYKCNACDKDFGRPFQLTLHIKKDHLDERSKCCQQCSYSCFSNNELKVHMIKQHGERSFQCLVCDKSFCSRKSLKQHSKVHR